MPNTIFAVLLGVLALYAVFSIFRAPTGRQKTGWLVLAVSAALQAVNLLSAYSLILAIVTTLGLLVGFWMIRSPAEPAARP